MATFALIHGAGSSAWYWHLVEPELRARGHAVAAMDLPVDDESAGLKDYADAVVDAIGDQPDELVVVAQSLAGFIAPMVAQRVPVRLIVLVAAMVPRPGETLGEWWTNTGHAFPHPFDEVEVFLHDVPADVAAASAAHVRPQSGTPFDEPWPLASWPAVPTRFLLCRHDRLFPVDFLRPVVATRLGLVPDEMAAGHLPALARPVELAARLDTYWSDVSKAARAGEIRGDGPGVR